MGDNSDYFVRSASSFMSDSDAPSYVAPNEQELRDDEEIKKKAEEKFQETPFCKRFSYDIIIRAPDRMCDFIEGFVVLAYR